MAIASDFHDERFPLDIAFGSTGGPERNTEIVTLGSGHEQRNQRWARSRRRYEVGYGVKDLDALYQVMAFFEARRGPLHAFRFRDALDWKSCSPLATPEPGDQVLGTGDSTMLRFPLVKTYGIGEAAYHRSILKPIADSVRVAVGGDEVFAPIDFAVDPADGAVVFQAQSAPPTGAVVTAGFEFDVPVRFASDRLDINLAAFNAGDAPSIPLVEVQL